MEVPKVSGSTSEGNRSQKGVVMRLKRRKFEFYEWSMLALFAAFGILLGLAVNTGWWTLVPAAVMTAYGYGYMLFGNEDVVLGLEEVFAGWWAPLLVAGAVVAFVVLAVSGSWNPVTGVFFIIVAVVLLVFTAVSAPLAPHHPAHGTASTNG